MLTPEQLEKHNACITGSKVGSILGISPFKSKYELWAEMTGLVEREEFSSERMRMGNYAEAMMDEVCRGEWGWKVSVDKTGWKPHLVHDFMGGIIDRFRDGDDSYISILEYKNIDRMSLKDWDDNGIPAQYEAQCRFYSMLYELPCILVVVFGGNTVRKYEIPRNPNIEAYILKECLQFWDDIQNMKAPEPDGSDSTSNALAKLYPDHNVEMLDGDESLADTIGKHIIFKEVEKRAKKKKQEYGNKIKSIIGENQGVICESGEKATWKKTKDGVTFNEKRFADDNEEMYNRYLEVKPGHKVLRTTLPKKPKQIEGGK